MKIATLATVWFAARFAMAVIPDQTANIQIVPAHFQNAGVTDLDTDGLRTGPDLMLVPRDSGIVEA